MCELFGVCFSSAADTSSYLEVFFKRSEFHPHGWGVACYPPECRNAFIVKEPVRACDSARAAEAARDASFSSLLIAHIRHASAGAHTMVNTHPFAMERDGEEYIFAHNGNIPDFAASIPLGGILPKGETDSEHVFCNLMASVEDGQIDTAAPDGFPSLQEKLAGYNAFGTFNCLFISHGMLFGYHDKDGSNGLHYLEKEIGGARGCILSSRPLTDENWISFGTSQMHVFKGGRMIF